MLTTKGGQPLRVLWSGGLRPAGSAEVAVAT
jgi:hypothetical protein